MRSRRQTRPRTIGTSCLEPAVECVNLLPMQITLAVFLGSERKAGKAAMALRHTCQGQQDGSPGQETLTNFSLAIKELGSEASIHKGTEWVFKWVKIAPMGFLQVP